MALHDRRLQEVNRSIDGDVATGRVFPKIDAAAIEKTPDGNQVVTLYDGEYWLPVGDSINDESRVWKTPVGDSTIFQYDTNDHTAVRLPTPEGEYGEPLENAPTIGVYAADNTTVLSTPMTCLEYSETEDPERTGRMHCIERLPGGEADAVLRLALEHHDPDIVERELRTRLGDEAVDAVDAFVRDVVDSTPDVVYHKCSLKTLISTLRERKYQKIDDSRGSRDVVKHRNMSTSDIHMPQTRLKTPWQNQQVTIKMRVPSHACPIRIVYDLPAAGRHTNWYSDEYRYYNNVESALIDTLYSIRLIDALRDRCPACARIGVKDIERKGKLEPYAYEREIFLIPEDGENLYILPEDVLEIIAEGECQTSADYVRTVLEDNGLGAFVSRVAESEFCEIAHETLRILNVGEEVQNEQAPWKWDDRLSHRTNTNEWRREKIPPPT